MFNVMWSTQAFDHVIIFPQGGGELPYETDGDARRTTRVIFIKPLKETNLGVAQALFEP